MSAEGPPIANSFRMKTCYCKNIQNTNILRYCSHIFVRPVDVLHEFENEVLCEEANVANVLRQGIVVV